MSKYLPRHQVILNIILFFTLYFCFVIYLIDYDVLKNNLAYFFGITSRDASPKLYKTLFYLIYSVSFLYLILYAWKVRTKKANLYYLTQVYEVLSNYGLEVIRSIRLFKKKHKIVFFLFFGLLLLYRMVLIFLMPLEYDEIMSLVRFIKTPITFPLRWYHGLSNNHILYSFLANLLHKTEIDLRLVLRLPTLLASCMVSLVVFFFIYKRYNFTQALIFVILSNALFPLNYYATVGRGYSLHIVFATLGFLALYKLILEKQLSTRYFVLFVISSILGFYTAPSYLYIFISFYALLVIFYLENLEVLFKIFWVGFYTVLGVVFLYTPHLLSSGWGSFTNSSHKDFQKHSWSEGVEFVPKLYEALFGFYFGNLYWGGFIFGLIVLMLIYLANKHKTYFTASFTFMYVFLHCMPAFFTFAHRVFSFPRMWSVLHIINVMAIFIILQQLKNYKLKLSLTVVITVFQILFLIQNIYQDKHLGQTIKYSYQQQQDIMLIAQALRPNLERGEKIYTNYPFHLIYFSYYLLKNEYTYFGLLGFQSVEKAEEAEIIIIFRKREGNITKPKFKKKIETKNFIVYEKD